jgi:Calcineurin-like phosphoesterase
MLRLSTLILAISLLAWEKIPSEKMVKTEVTPQTIDGPYVLYKGDSILVQYIDSLNGVLSLRTSLLMQSQKDQLQLVVQTDEPGKTFNVKLHTKYTPEKATYSKPKKMLVISDIEGEFAALRKLLQANGVIDKDYHWTFGEGHLVMVGDFVDRGTMVTEVLWLAYSLENQAEAAGGKVHFILGNHEIMNMNGDHHYVHPRYMAHADSMRVPYLDLFGQNAELGRWLATKNITERIGNILFAHGGFSSYMNQAQIPIKGISDTARLYYTDTSANYPSIYSELLFSDFGPFWYRGYYLGTPRATAEQVDSTLNLYESRYIVTGHTVVAKEIVSMFGGKVINIDLPHKLGISEALMIEGNKMYRVNANAEQMKITNMN